MVSWAAPAPHTAHTTSVPCVLLPLEGKAVGPARQKEVRRCLVVTMHVLHPLFAAKHRMGQRMATWESSDSSGDAATKDGPVSTVS